MQKTYWKPQSKSSFLMAFAAVLSVLSVGAVEYFPTASSASSFSEKRQAARLADRAFRVIKAERIKRNIPIDSATDPLQSGLVGAAMSPVTSNNGHLPAKQTSINPNFAAVVVELLRQANVKKGDTVAVGLSGSFPALNIAVIAALESLEIEPLMISSASASQWGANHPEFLWIDMESALTKAGVFSTRSLAASLGGVDDRGIGMSEVGVRQLRDAVARNNLPLIDPESFEDSIQSRMQLYDQQADGEPIKAYINVGGGTVSVGTSAGKHQFEPGLNRDLPQTSQVADSVMSRFAAEGIPVIHLVQVRDLALRYGLPPQLTSPPQVGEGRVYSPQTYNLWLATAAFASILFVLAWPGLQHAFRGATRLTDRQIRNPNENSRPTLQTRSTGIPEHSRDEAPANHEHGSDPIL